MYKRLFLYMLFSQCLLGVAAQQGIVESLQQSSPGEGVVVVHQNDKLSALIGTPAPKTGKTVKAMGYRVQVYMGNNSREARANANEAASYIRTKYPSLTVYAHFDSPRPRWVCRVGDYRSIEEADAAMRILKTTGRFKDISVVKVLVNIPE